MKNNTLTVKLLKDLKACKSGIDFVKRNGLEGLSLDLLDKTRGDHEGFVSWLKEALSTEREYDTQGNKIKETDPNGDVWTYEYDTQGNTIKQTAPYGDVWTYEYINTDEKLVIKVDGSIKCTIYKK